MAGKAFALVQPWPDHRAAEHEFAERLAQAAANIGVGCRMLDCSGRDLQTGARVRGDEVDFVIAMHFATPKTADAFSFIHLCNPLQAYFNNGYEQCTANLLTYDDFLSCGSESNDAHISRSLPHEPLHLAPELSLYLTLSESSVLPPVRKQRRLFYIGGNWESRRHAALLTALDRQKLIEMYGVRAKKRLLRRGYRQHRGELPFDGRAVIDKISELGASLAIASPAHVASGVMTMRLFESIAAGAVVITDYYPFVTEHFGDSLLYVDAGRPDAADRVAEHLTWMNRHPDEALQMAQKAQRIFSENFTAEHGLKNIYKALAKRKKTLTLKLDPADTANPKVHQLYLLTDPSPAGMNRLKDTCCSQDYRNRSLTIALEPDPTVERELTARLEGQHPDFRLLPTARFADNSLNRMGRVLADTIESVRNEDFDYLNIVSSAERPFSNHLSTLVRLLRRDADKQVGASAEILEDLDQADWKKRAVAQTSTDFSGDLARSPIGFARFIFRKEVLDDDTFALLRYLNRKALAALTTDRPMARSGLATVCTDRHSPLFGRNVAHEMEDPLIQQVYPSFAGHNGQTAQV